MTHTAAHLPPIRQTTLFTYNLVDSHQKSVDTGLDTDQVALPAAFELTEVVEDVSGQESGMGTKEASGWVYSPDADAFTLFVLATGGQEGVAEQTEAAYGGVVGSELMREVEARVG